MLSLVGASQTCYAVRTIAHNAAEKGDSDVEYTFHLFVRPKDLKAEQWDGARSGIQAALDVFNADEVRTMLLYMIV